MIIKFTKNLDNIDYLIKELKKGSNEIGAISIFMGVVRGIRKDEKVLRLEYEAYEKIAIKTIENIFREMKIKYNIIDSIVEHRINQVPTGEDALYVLVASRHRKEGYEALIEIVERIKSDVPIWKKEITEENTYWVENS
jgi:molybdopterin synthase catalytic subunit